MPEGTTTTVKKAEKKKTGLIIGIIVAIVAIVAAVVGIILVNANKDSVVGSYVLTGIMNENGEEDASAMALLKAFGVSLTLEMKEDHTGVMEAYGQKTEFTWDEKNIKGKDEDGNEQTMEYTYENGKLTFTEDGQKMVFTKKELVKEDETSGDSSVDLNGLFGGDEDTDADTDTDTEVEE